MENINKQLEQARKQEPLKELYILPKFIIKFNKQQKQRIKEEAFSNSLNPERLEYDLKDGIVRKEGQFIYFETELKEAIKSLLSLRKTLENAINKRK